jgi:hypothetical protein
MKRMSLVLCLLSPPVVLLGCKAEETTYEVSGTVTLDKKPLKEGEIAYVDKKGSVPVTMTITEGSYKGKARPGEYRVEIRAYKVGKKLEPGPGVGKGEHARENYLPERFNTKSQLKTEVKAEGANQAKFEVTSQ